MKKLILASLVAICLSACSWQPPQRQGKPTSLTEKSITKDHRLNGVILDFAQKLKVSEKSIREETFLLDTLSGERIPITGPSLYRSDFPKQGYEELENLFADWEIYNPFDGVQESFAYYLQGDLVCQKHLILNDEPEFESLEGEYSLWITCGKNPRSKKALFENDILVSPLERDCFDTKSRLIEAANEVRPYLEELEKEEQIGPQSVGLTSFLLTRESVEDGEEIFLITEYHREADGSIRELPTKRFLLEKDNPRPFIYNVVEDQYEPMTYDDESLIDNFWADCEAEIEESEGN